MHYVCLTWAGDVPVWIHHMPPTATQSRGDAQCCLGLAANWV